jgi:hypothetical protein
VAREEDIPKTAGDHGGAQEHDEDSVHVAGAYLLEETPVKFRIAAAVLLFVVGIALPIAAMAKRGPPWGFRGHAAVVLDSAGKIEVMRGEDKVVDVKPGVFLDNGDIVRVPRFGEAHLRLPSADILVGDGSMVTLVDKSFTLGKGVVEVTLPKGTLSGGGGPFDVKADGIDGKLTLRPGSEGGIARVVADGQSEIRAYVKNGSCEASASGTDEIAETGKVIAIGSDKRVHVEGAPSSLTIAPVCDGKRVSVDVPPGTQTFMASNLYFPRDGKVSAEVSSGSVSVFARDVVGNFARVVVQCKSK